MFDEKEIQWDLVPLILLVLLCICSLQGCGNGWALLPAPQSGCRTIITSEAAQAQFEDVPTPQTRAVRMLRRRIEE